MTIKGQATIPLFIRKSLGLEGGDVLSFILEGDHLIARKAEPFDQAYHAALANTLSEWDSKEDDDAFQDL